MTREREMIIMNLIIRRYDFIYIYFFLFQTMKKIWVIVTSIAGIAWLMWLWWTVWNDWFYSWYPMWFTTQDIQINWSDCGSKLTEDPWFQNHIETVNPMTVKDAQKAVNEYSKSSKIPLCVNSFTVSDFWLQPTKNTTTSKRKSIVWMCKGPARWLKACRITWWKWK